jgi:hypothetical protein
MTTIQRERSPLFTRYHKVAATANIPGECKVRFLEDDDMVELESDDEQVLEKSKLAILAVCLKTIDCNYFIGFRVNGAAFEAAVAAINNAIADAIIPEHAVQASKFVVSSCRRSLCMLPLRLYSPRSVRIVKELLDLAPAEDLALPYEIHFAQGLKALGTASLVASVEGKSAQKLRTFTQQLHQRLTVAL